MLVLICVSATYASRTKNVPYTSHLFTGIKKKKIEYNKSVPQEDMKLYA